MTEAEITETTNSMIDEVFNQPSIKCINRRYAFWSEWEQRMFMTGHVIDVFTNEDYAKFSLRFLEKSLWRKALRGFISRNDFRNVYRYLKRGWSPIGDD